MAYLDPERYYPTDISRDRLVVRNLSPTAPRREYYGMHVLADRDDFDRVVRESSLNDESEVR